MGFAYLFYFSSFIASIINPFWGLVGLIVSILIRFQDRFPGIAAIKPFSLLFLGMIIGCVVNREKLAKHKWKQDQLLLGMLGMSVFGLLILNPGDLVFQTWEFISSLAFYYFASRIMQKPSQFVILFSVMSCCIVYMGYEAIVDVAANPETSLFIDPRQGRWQGLGYYANANEFGQLMVTTLPFLFAALLMKNNILLKLVAIAFIAILIFVVGKTGSRTVMVLLGLMVIGTLTLRGNGNVIKKGLTGGIVTIGVLFVLSFAPGPIQERLQTVLDAGNDKSFQGRTRAWDQGFQMVTWYPITGVGKGQWNDYHGRMPHNSYVQIMAELGPIGIFLFLWVIRLCIVEFKPFFVEPDPKSDSDPPGISSAMNKIELHPIWGTPIQSTGKVEGVEKRLVTEPVDMQIKTVVIAVAVVMGGWLTYIFLGNQGYAVWTYFYIGLCTAVRNIHPKQIQQV
ncbi:MAG: O-antigen ligase family protein [Kangiellaceae bacterium]|nr:O-antigen ligase family protein [Kangiellaceae bacterium]